MSKNLKIFLSTPMTKEYGEIRMAISKGLEELNCETIMIEEQIKPNELWTETVNKYLKNSDFVIADVTDNNLFVAFELGYALASGIPTLILIQKDQDLKQINPMIHGQVFMKYDPHDLSKLSRMVRNFLAHGSVNKR